MEGMIENAKEVAKSRFERSRARKQQVIAMLEKSMKKKYEKQTGLSADYFFAM